MEEARIDISIFKACSVRGAACSTSTGVGVATKDILDAIDWSSEGTFQKFYCRELEKDDQTTFVTVSGKTGLIAHSQVSRNGGFKYSKCCSLSMVAATRTKFSHVLQQSITFQILQ